MPEPVRVDVGAPVLELTRQLCDVPSESGDERALADAIESALLPLTHLRVERNGDAVIARTDLGRERRVVIAGHIDTVPINDNLPTRLEGDELWGRGTVDMKGGCAVMLRLAAALVDPVVDVTWVFYDHEEVESTLNGLGRISRERPELLEADFAVLCEPTDAEVEGGCNGTLRVDVLTEGVRAHSARAWMGVNAIHAAAAVLQRLVDVVPEEVEVEGLVYRESINAVGIEGGIAGNVIPDRTVIQVNYRFAPSRTAAQAIDRMLELFDGYEVRIADAVDGARPGLDRPLAQEFVRAVGGTPKAKYGWTDVARFSALGIPAVNYGPGDPMRAHADDERLQIDELDRCEAGLRAWLTGS